MIRASAVFALTGALLAGRAYPQTAAVSAEQNSAGIGGQEAHEYLLCTAPSFSIGEAPGMPFTAQIEKVQRQVGSGGELGAAQGAPIAVGLAARDSKGRVLVRNWVRISAADAEQPQYDAHQWNEVICDPVKGTIANLWNSGQGHTSDQDKQHTTQLIAAYHRDDGPGRENLQAETYEGLPAFRYRFPNTHNDHSLYEIVNSDELLAQLAQIKWESFPETVEDTHLTQIRREEPPATLFAGADEQAPAARGRFAVEISRGGQMPSTTTIPEAGSSSTLFYGGKIDLFVPTSPGVELPSALKVEYKVDEDTVTITPIFFYGNFDTSQMPASLERLRSRTLPSHSGKLGDSVSFAEMAEVGLEPLTANIVSAQPDTSYKPKVSSNAPSVEMRYEPVDVNGGVLILHNLSSKAVSGVRINAFDGAKLVQGFGTESGSLGEVIAPGARYQLNGPGRSGRTVNGTFVETRPSELVLDAVLFTDGSYEGDAQVSAEMACRGFGRHAQLERIKLAAEPILAADGLSDAAKIEQIRAAIQKLPTQPDSEIVAQFHARFSTIPEAVLTAAEEQLGTGMKTESDSMARQIQLNEHNVLESKQTLARWWAMETEEH